MGPVFFLDYKEKEDQLIVVWLPALLVAGMEHHYLLLLGLLCALAVVKKEASADPVPAAEAEADPYYRGYGYGGYRGYGGYGGYGRRYYGKRSADPRHYGYGGYGRKMYKGYGYGKREAEAEADPHHRYYGGGYGGKRYGYGSRYYGYGKRSAGPEMTGPVA